LYALINGITVAVAIKYSFLVARFNGTQQIVMMPVLHLKKTSNVKCFEQGSENQSHTAGERHRKSVVCHLLEYDFLRCESLYHQLALQTHYQNIWSSWGDPIQQ
jgi:hypothetical protein